MGNSHPLLRRGALAVAAALALSGAYQFGRSGVPQAVAASVPPAALQVPTITLPDFESIAARLGAAVVNVQIEGPTRTAASPRAQIGPNDPFGEFFRRFGPGFPLPGEGPVRRGEGSGFIVASDGVILTNAHVVEGAAVVTVRLTDRREFEARVVGLDKPSDVAVLKIDAVDLPTIPLGDPAETHVGEWVLAIGSPFGFENSVTAGIVSAKSRSLPDEGYVPFIQTDVAINPGNSGGPLINLAGQVIGINSQIYSRSGGYQGLSFAIPIDVAARVKDQLLADGKVTRGRMGVMVQDLNKGLAESFGLEGARGALVSQVEADGPAAKAGLRAGDVILALDGKAVERSSDLPPRVAALAPGSRAALAVWRDGERKRLEVTVGALESEQLAAADQPDADQGRLGLALRPLRPDERSAGEASGGLLVLEVAGPALRAGIRPGDLVLALNGRPLRSVEELRGQLAEAGEHVALLIQRADARIFIPVDLG